MPRRYRGYYGSRWSGLSGLTLSFVGALAVFALAALTGAVIGGVGIYLINDAVAPPPSAATNSTLADRTPPPSPTQTASQRAPGVTNGGPVRTVDPTLPQPPLSTESGNASAPVAIETATRPPADASASPASTPAQPKASQPPAPVQTQSSPASPTASQAVPQDESQTTTHDTAAQDTAAQGTAAPAAAPAMDDQIGPTRKAAVAKKRRVTSTRRPGPQAYGDAQSTAHRSFYDYYDRDDDQRRISATDAESRVHSRVPRARRSYDRDDEADRAAFPGQPRPAQSSFGLFGRDRYDHSRQDDRD